MSRTPPYPVLRSIPRGEETALSLLPSEMEEAHRLMTDVGIPSDFGPHRSLDLISRLRILIWLYLMDDAELNDLRMREWAAQLARAGEIGSAHAREARAAMNPPEPEK